MKTRLFCSIFPIALFMAFGFSTINAEKATVLEEKESFVFIQLFTSQGCSSCPPADLLLEEIKNSYANKNVFVASYHVDYWDRLGWKDPFGKSDFTTLQHAYGFKFNSRSVYTPQAVVNGNIHFVGSNKDSMNTYVSKYLKTASENSITLSDITKKNKSIKFRYAVKGPLQSKKLKVALVIDKRETIVKRGENEGRTLVNSNIVIEEIELSLHKQSGEVVLLIPEIVTDEDSLSVIAYVQSNNLSINGAGSAAL